MPHRHTDVDMIDTPQGLAALAERAFRVGHLALDTEFVWERTYYPQLGLVQAALSADECLLVDTVALPDLSPLGPVLASPHVVKILHDPEQDLTILRRATGAATVNVFDTQLAGGFVGLTATSSLGDMVEALFGVDLPKGATRTNWLRRPLSDEQLDYALDDVRYLPESRERLRARARERGREDWLREEMKKYDDPGLYVERDPYTMHERVGGRGRLSRKQLAVLREAAAWREQEARRQDVPRKHVVPDAILKQVARRTPKSRSDLNRIKGKYDRNRYGDALLQSVEAGLSAPDDERPPRPSRRDEDDVTNARADFALAYVRGRSLSDGIDPQLAATRADVTALVYDGEDPVAAGHDLLSGWRYDFIGEELQSLLRGELAITLDAVSGLPRVARTQREPATGSTSTSASP